MMCEKVYQSEICWEFSELCTMPCQSFTLPHSQIGGRPIGRGSPPASVIRPAASRSSPCQADAPFGAAALRIGRLCVADQAPRRSASRAISSDVAILRCALADRPEAGLFVGADGPRVGRIGIDDDARRAFLEQLVRRTAATIAEPWPMPTSSGIADRQVDAERAERLVL